MAKVELRGGFQNSFTRRPATRKRQAAWSSDRTTKPSRSPRSRCAGRRAGSAQGEALVLQEPGVAALDRPAPLAEPRPVRPAALVEPGLGPERPAQAAVALGV